MADTDILLSVDLDVKDAEKTAEQLQKEVKGIFDSGRGQQSAALTSLEIQMKQTYDKISRLKEKLKELGDTPVATEEYAKLTEQLSKYEERYYSLIEKMSQFEEAGGDISSAKYQEWVRQFEQVEASLATIHNRMEQMEKDGTAFISGTETEQYKQLQIELDRLSDKLKQQIIRYDELENKGKTSVDTVTKSMESLREETERTRKATGDVSTNVSGGFAGATKSISRLLGKFGMLFLGVRGLYSLLMKVRSAILEGFKNLQESGVGKLKKQMNDLSNATTTLKNALAGAFEPIVTTIIPYIQQLVEWLTVAIDKLAQFIAIMHGQTTYIKAIKQVGKAGEKAAKQLAKFDELNILKSPKGNGAAGMFEEVPVSAEMIEWMKDLKDTLDDVRDMHGFINTYFFPSIKDFFDWFFGTLGLLKALLLELYNKYIKPLFDKIHQHIQQFITNVQGILDRIGILRGYVSQFLGFITGVYNTLAGLMARTGQMFKSIGDGIISKLRQIHDFLASRISAAMALAGMLAQSIQNHINNMISNVKRIFDFMRMCLQIAGAAWQAFKDIVSNAIDAIKEKLQPLLDMINKVKDAFDDLSLSDIKNALNIKGTTTLNMFGSGQSSGSSNIKSGILNPNMIALIKPFGFASGGVIPASASEHLIRVGDNNHESEVVSPLSTMQEAMISALQAVGFGNNSQPINIYLGTEKIYSEIKKLEKRDNLMGG